MVPVIGFLLIALAALLVLLGVRAWHIKNLFLRLPPVVLSGLLALVFALIGAVALIGVYRLDTPRGNPASDLRVAAAPDRLARGAQLAHLCAPCHSTTGNLPLDGGTRNFLAGLGTLYAPNLTPGGPLADWSDGEIIRAIREGIDKNGRALLIMPSEDFHQMSDADVQAIVAYLRTQPSVSHATPPRTVGLIGTLLIGTGLFPTSAQAPITQPVSSPPAAVTAEYGEYLVAISGCRSCHGPDLSGGRADGGPPPGPNLTRIIPSWSEDDFLRTIRTGTDPQGHRLAPDQMPWQALSAAYSDDELKAIYVYLHGLKPIERASFLSVQVGG